MLSSQLEPTARLLVLALLSKVDNETAVIPPQYSPSLTTIQAMTGLSRSAVAEWLQALESAGWVKRTPPSRGSDDRRTQYALAVGAPVAGKKARPSRKQAAAAGVSEARNSRGKRRGRKPRPATAGPHDGLDAAKVVRTTDHQASENAQFGSPHSGPVEEAPSPHHGLELVRLADHPSPPHGPATTKSSPTESSTYQHPPASASPTPNGTPTAEASPSTGLFPPPHPTSVSNGDENAGTILAAFLDYCGANQVRIPKQIRGQYAKRIKEALDDGFTPKQVKQALNLMFNQQVANRPSLLPNKLVELQTGPERRRSTPAAPVVLPDDAELADAWKGL